jgi:hypothetical protein
MEQAKQETEGEVRKVRLTRAQLTICKTLGLTPQQYAREILRLEDEHAAAQQRSTIMGKRKYKTKRSRGMNSNTAWTEPDIDTLTTMYHAGFSNWDISVALGRSSGAVTQRIYQMGLHKNVSDTLTTQDATMDVTKDNPQLFLGSVTTTSTLKRWWNRLMGKGAQ